MRNVAGFALTVSASFLAVVALLIGSPALFYIATGLIATIAASRLQAYLAVRGLRIERIVPGTVQVGELVTVEMTVWSEYRIRRTLITVKDKLPVKLALSHLSPSLPIAPAYDVPIRTQYQFRALRRGRYRWSGVTVEGTDAIGIVSKTLDYPTAPTEMLILPRPIPVNVELPAAAGWGISEAVSGQTRGAGIEPRGIRPYASGDSLRHVHWPSTARTGQLLVKEFEAGSQASVGMLLQRTKGSEIPKEGNTSLELMCGHAAYLADQFIRQGIRVDLFGIEDSASHHTPHERFQEVLFALAEVQADQAQSLSSEAANLLGTLPPGCVLFIFLVKADPNLPMVMADFANHGTTVVPLIYDANSLDPKRKTKYEAASDPEYMAQLQSVGTFPILMPIEGDLTI